MLLVTWLDFTKEVGANDYKIVIRDLLVDAKDHKIHLRPHSPTSVEDQYKYWHIIQSGKLEYKNNHLDIFDKYDAWSRVRIRVGGELGSLTSLEFCEGLLWNKLLLMKDPQNKLQRFMHTKSDLYLCLGFCAFSAVSAVYMACRGKPDLWNKIFKF